MAIFDLRRAKDCRPNLEELNAIKSADGLGIFPYETVEAAESSARDFHRFEEESKRIRMLSDQLIALAVERFHNRYTPDSQTIPLGVVRHEIVRLLEEEKIDELQTFLTDSVHHGYFVALRNLRKIDTGGWRTWIFHALLGILEIAVFALMLAACRFRFETMAIGGLAFVYSNVMFVLRGHHRTQAANYGLLSSDLNRIRRLLKDPLFDVADANATWDSRILELKKDEIPFYIQTAKFTLIEIMAVGAILYSLL